MIGLKSSDLIGTDAPDWQNEQWINSRPLKLSDLRGKVVLMRFFMESDCPMCRASAPYLNEFHRQYKERGLAVIGMYTPKPQPRKTSVETVRRFVQDYGFEFPVALDNDWATLKIFWLDRVPDADFTSVSFLIDKNGIIRYIHPGGAYTAKDADAIRSKIEAFLAKP